MLKQPMKQERILKQVQDDKERGIDSSLMDGCMYDTENIVELLAMTRGDGVLMGKSVAGATEQWSNGAGEKSKGVAIMVFGGFHRQRITEILRSKGIGYEVIVPAMKGRYDRGIYEKRIKDVGQGFT